MYKLMVLREAGWTVYCTGSQAEMLLNMSRLLEELRRKDDRTIMRVMVVQQVANERV